LLDRRAKLSVSFVFILPISFALRLKDNDRRKNRENDPNRKGIPESHQPDLIGSDTLAEVLSVQAAARALRVDLAMFNTRTQSDIQAAR
jgi:hypothetical protein